jgi:hypothetical protein
VGNWPPKRLVFESGGEFWFVRCRAGASMDESSAGQSSITPGAWPPLAAPAVHCQVQVRSRGCASGPSGPGARNFLPDGLAECTWAVCTPPALLLAGRQGGRDASSRQSLSQADTTSCCCGGRMRRRLAPAMAGLLPVGAPFCQRGRRNLNPRSLDDQHSRALVSPSADRRENRASSPKMPNLLHNLVGPT